MAQFAVIIPTRNRPEALRMTLAGLAEARYDDVVFTVSDNSDDEIVSVNRNIVGSLLAARPHRYIRPDRVLPMIAHWNFALTNTPRSAFTGFITDRMTLVPDALAICDQVLSETHDRAVSFHSKEVSLRNGTDLPVWPASVVARRHQSTKVLADFARSRLRKDSPRFLNSFVSRDILDEIEARFGSVFGGISPDYAFAFRFLEVAPGHHHIEAPLLIDHSPQISNGMAVTRNIDNAAKKDFIQRLNSEQSAEFAFGPIPFEARLLNNVILREMEIARADANGLTRFPQIDPAAFHIACAGALRRSIRLFDHDSRQLQAQIEKYRQEHSLPQWSARVRRSNFVIATRNSVTRSMGRTNLPGIARDLAGDRLLLENLRNLPRPTVDYASADCI